MSDYEAMAERLIQEERRRQVDEEGWTPEHDREHGAWTLTSAAEAYLTHNVGLWPWDGSWWKPKGPFRDFVRAGALAQAAIDINPDSTEVGASRTASTKRAAVVALTNLLRDVATAFNAEPLRYVLGTAVELAPPPTAQQIRSLIAIPNQHPRIMGYCPACGHDSRFIASGGYLTCSRIECPNPAALADILEDREIEHVVKITEGGLTVRHPLIERLDNKLMECTLHTALASLSGPPALPGTYRVVWVQETQKATSWQTMEVPS